MCILLILKPTNHWIFQSKIELFPLVKQLWCNLFCGSLRGYVIHILKNSPATHISLEKRNSSSDIMSSNMLNTKAPEFCLPGFATFYPPSPTFDPQRFISSLPEFLPPTFYPSTFNPFQLRCDFLIQANKNHRLLQHGIL